MTGGASGQAGMQAALYKAGIEDMKERERESSTIRRTSYNPAAAAED